MRKIGVPTTNPRKIKERTILRMVLNVPHCEVKSGLYKLIMMAIALIMKDLVTTRSGAAQCRFLLR